MAADTSIGWHHADATILCDSLAQPAPASPRRGQTATTFAKARIDRDREDSEKRILLGVL